MSKKQKIMLVGAIIGSIVGAILGANEESILIGIWFGIGFGGNIDLILDIPGVFSISIEEDGLLEAIKTTIVGSLFWAIIFTLFGPIGFLVRFFKK